MYDMYDVCTIAVALSLGNSTTFSSRLSGRCVARGSGYVLAIPVFLQPRGYTGRSVEQL